MPNSKLRESRLTLSLNQDEFEAIDTWRFENRLPSRAAAVRELIGRGISSTAAPIDPGAISSKDVGVVSSAIARATNECFVVTDPHMDDNPIVYASPGFYKTTGYNERDVIGNNCRFLQGVETDKSTVRELCEALADERTTDVKILNFTKDGTPIWFHLHIEPVPNPETGELLFFVGRQFRIE